MPSRHLPLFFARLSAKSSLFPTSNWPCHKLSNRIEHDFECLSYLLFEFVQPGEFRVRREQLSELYKRAHDFDIDGDRKIAVQNT